MRTVALFVVIAGLLTAQSPGDPLTLIRVVRKSVSSRNPVNQYFAGKPLVQVFGLRSITGNSQVWLIEAHGTFASLEETDRALAGNRSASDEDEELMSPSLSQVGLYRHGLSYRPDEAVKLMPQAKYMQVSIYRSRPGFDIDFDQLMRMRKATLDRVNVDRPELGYQVISGGLSGTYWFIAPLTSMKTLDESVARWLRYDNVPSGGGPGSRQITAEGDITREQLLFRVDPKLGWSPEQAR